MNPTPTTIIGNGAWGTAVALVLLENGHPVTIWGHDAAYLRATSDRRENLKFLPGVPLPPEIRFETDAASAVQDAGLLVSAVPTRFLRQVLEGFRGHVRSRVAVVSLTKGIEVQTLLRPCQIIRQMLPGRPVAVLSGPSHAEEVARRIPTSVVVSASSDGLRRRLQRAFNTPRFRVYRNSDTVGVELGGALKNIIALAAGVCDGLGFGDNTKAALVTRGIAEMTRLATRLGARRATFSGLAGIGDLITTAFSAHGRNRAVGEQLGRGRTLQQVLEATEKVAEGVLTTKAAMTLARRTRVDMPISREMHEVLFRDKDPAEALESLMSRAAKNENW
jgi:glycerol-3-phosphate dehydrogenase (NAD(P)+)